MIFGARNTHGFDFKLGSNNISIIKEFKYLGVVFSNNRNFFKAIKHNVEHARKAMHLLYKRIQNLHIPIDLQIQLFHHTILPILLYGCEVWGFQNIKMIENLYNQFFRSIIKVRKSTPIYMIYAELGIKPVEIQIKSRMINFWVNTLNSDNSKFSKIMLNIMRLETDQGVTFKWLNFIKEILVSVGKPFLLNQDFIINPKAMKQKITRRLHDITLQEWNSKLRESTKGRNYAIFKDNTELEAYLKMLSKNEYIPLAKFRTSNHKLPVETGRWDNTPYHDRKCVLCHKNDIGDEFHYLLICPTFINERKKLLEPVYYQRPNILKYQSLLNSRNKKTLSNLSKFVKVIMNTFS